MDNLFKTNKLDDPAVCDAIRILKSKGITLEQIQQVYEFYETLNEKIGTEEWRNRYLHLQFPSYEEQSL